MSSLLGARRDPRMARAGAVVLGIGLAIMPFVVGAGAGTAWVRVLDFALLYIMLALGLNIVVGFAGLLDLGYIAFYAVGAYLYALLSSPHLAVAFPALAPGLHWPVWVILPLGALVAGTFGVILGAPTLRLRGDYLAIVTLGFGEIIRITANNLEWLGASPGISNIPKPPSVGPLKFRLLDAKPYYWLALTLIIFVVLATRSLERSRIGRYWTAIREDEDAAELMGVPTFHYKLLAFATGAAMGGLSGVLYAGRVGFINPDTFPLDLSILFLAAVVLGGAGNLPGVILGAVVVAYVPERFRFLQERRVMFFGIALVLMMIFRPQGLLPRKVHGSRTYAGDGSARREPNGGAPEVAS